MWFFDQLDELKEALQSEYKDDLTLHAFGSWQITEVLKAMISGDKYKATQFGKYLEKMNLSDPKPSTDIDKFEKLAIQHEKQKALESASEILEKFRKGRDNKND
jgi:hypothetical protein